MWKVDPGQAYRDDRLLMSRGEDERVYGYGDDRAVFFLRHVAPRYEGWAAAGIDPNDARSRYELARMLERAAADARSAGRPPGLELIAERARIWTDREFHSGLDFDLPELAPDVTEALARYSRPGTAPFSASEASAALRNLETARWIHDGQRLVPVETLTLGGLMLGALLVVTGLPAIGIAGSLAGAGWLLGLSAVLLVLVILDFGGSLQMWWCMVWLFAGNAVATIVFCLRRRKGLFVRMLVFANLLFVPIVPALLSEWNYVNEAAYLWLLLLFMLASPLVQYPLNRLQAAPQ
ncbi:MAG: hypothetical protein KDC98_15210 [Planctomycetes bacterium]|nr:hypothetical protein [Planctomycetota bacterium]